MLAEMDAPRIAVPASTYVPEACRVRRVEPLTALERLLEIERPTGAALGHAPGQFVQVSILGVGECPISICSSPTRGTSFQLCVRKVGAVTEQIHQLRAGDAVGIRGPLGHGFEVSELWDQDVLVIAGGLGLAPARSLIQYILDERERFGRFFLLYGARNPDEMLFREDLVRWRHDPRVEFQATVDRPDEQWRGKVGVVTTLFDALPRLDPHRTRVAIIGPPVMFKFAVLEVLARRIPQRSIYCSLERRMKCGVGKCGHCQANDIYVCTDGPVFTYARLKSVREALE